MSYLVRQATPADISSMHRIRQSVRENRLSPNTTINKQSYRSFLAVGSIWVAEEDSQIYGFAAIDFTTATVWALFVDPAREGTGIGRALHGVMLQRARDRGFRRLSLSTDVKSRAAGFYREGGWRQTRVTSDGEAFFEKQLL